MPRIRTLKPEHKQHRKVGMLTHRQYRLWVGMVTEADDDGRLCADAAQLRALVFAYHPGVSVKHVASDLEAIAAVGLVRLYRVGETVYADFPSWRDHQKLDRAHYMTSKLPSFQHSTPASLNGDSGETPTSQGREGNLTTQGTEGSHAAAPAETRPVPGAHANGFQIPEGITRALHRMPLLGPALQDAAWWQSELRAHPALDLASEALKAEAWCRSNPDRAPRKRARRFLHSWFDRAEAP